MRKIYLVLSTAIVVGSFSACKNAANEDAVQNATNLNQYVDSVVALKPVYTQENFTKIDNAYQEMAMESEKTINQLAAADKAKAEASKEQYAALKAKYVAKIKELEDANAVTASSDYRQILRSSLFGEGKIGSDMKFDYVTTANILSVYDKFVNKIADNRNNYTREDWDEIIVLYEALDSRKNEVEPLAARDNRKIAGLKFRFTTLKATHRDRAKSKENAAAKS